MNKTWLFLFCVLFVQTKSDNCSDDFFKCFSDFADSFFQNITKIEHVNAPKNIPGGYAQVKDVELKTIEELTQAVQNVLFKQVISRENSPIVVTDNPKTKIYVKTFSHYFEDSFLPDFENYNLGSDKQTEALTPFGIETANNDEQSTTVNLLPAGKDIDINDGENPIEIANNANETAKIESHLSILQTTTNTNNKVESTDIKENSTISKETLVASNEEKKHEMLDDFATITTRIIDFIFNQDLNTPDILKYRPYETKTANDAEDVKKNELAKDLPENISNINTVIDTLNANTQGYKTPDNRTITLNREDKKSLKENQFEKDIKENLVQTDDENYYDIEDTTDYPQIDYIDLYKDTTNEENIYVTDSPESDVINIKDQIVEHVEEYSLEIETDLDNDTSTNICHGNTSDVSNIFPWIVTIFIKNDTSNNQFQYACDGALLGNQLLITAARCVSFNNSTVRPDDVLVFLGKRSLQSIREGELNVRVSQIKLHGNFSAEDSSVKEDLALLVLEEQVVFSDVIRPACLGYGDAVGKSATTAWDLSGALTPVFFENKNEECSEMKKAGGSFCATYGNEVALCPSYGGVYAIQRASRWYLHGIRSGAPDTGLCYDKTVVYTTLGDQLEWIMDNME